MKRNEIAKLNSAQAATNRFGIGMLTPTLIVLLVMTAYPLIFTFVYSFTDYNYLKGTENASFVLFDNYVSLFKNGYFQQAVWSLRKAPYLGVRPVNWNGRKMTGSAWRMTNAVESWTWPGCEGQKATVEVYSDAEFVALYCNDKPVGKKRTKKFRAIFKLPYRPGTLKAVALDKSGNALGETTLQTAGQKTRLHLAPEKTTLRADGQSLCFIPITLTDAAGIWKPCANAKVHLEIEGPAALQALGSAATQTDETYLGSSHTTWLGRALAVIRAGTEPGKVRVTVTAEGYEPQYVDLTVE